MTGTVSIIALQNVPDIYPDDDLMHILGDCLATSGHGVKNGDIICVAHKIFSKAEGNIINLADVSPSIKAQRYAKELNKDPRKVEVILGQSSKVLRAVKRAEQNEGVMICQHHLGFISANAGVDQSNIDGDDTVITLPEDPDLSAKRLCQSLERRFDCQLGVVMSDTFGRPWRLGQLNVVIGLANVAALINEAGTKDAWGHPLMVTEPAFADEIAAASGLVIKKAGKTPLVLFRGLEWQTAKQSNARDILRSNKEDMFK